MHVMRYVMSRIFVFWLSVTILVYGWFNHTQLVNGGYGASEAFVRSLTRVDQTGKTTVSVLPVWSTLVRLLTKASLAPYPPFTSCV